MCWICDAADRAGAPSGAGRRAIGRSRPLAGRSRAAGRANEAVAAIARRRHRSAPRHVPGIARIGRKNLEAARIGQFEHRDPVDANRFHRHRLDTACREPVRQPDKIDGCGARRKASGNRSGRGQGAAPLSPPARARRRRPGPAAGPVGREARHPRPLRRGYEEAANAFREGAGRDPGDHAARAMMPKARKLAEGDAGAVD